jgi:predicted acetyltransferase
MKLQIPNISHKEQYKQLISDWSTYEDITKISPWALFEWSDFEDFLDIINHQRIHNPWIKVPAQLYFAIEWENIIWAIDIRFHINNDFLLQYGWHIWYWVSPIHRRKWYATKILELGLLECKNIGLEKVLVCCYTDNIGSFKTIEKNWGILENIIKWEGKNNSRYWIDIK